MKVILKTVFFMCVISAILWAFDVKADPYLDAIKAAERSIKDEIYDETAAAIGMSVAIATLPKASKGRSMVSIAGSYEAAAVGFSSSFGRHDRHHVSINYGANTFGEYIGAFGYGWEF